MTDLWLFSPSAPKFVPERPPALAFWWRDNHPAQQSFGQPPWWPNSFPWLSLVARPPCATDHCLGWHSHDPVAVRPQVLWHGSRQSPQLSGQGGPMVSSGNLIPQRAFSISVMAPLWPPTSAIGVSNLGRFTVGGLKTLGFAPYCLKFWKITIVIYGA